MGERGVLILVDRAREAQLGTLVRHLVRRWPDVLVHTSAAETLAAPIGAVVVLEPQLSDTRLLNRERPIFASRSLRVVLWCDRARAVALARNAPDFYDWISHRVACPMEPPPHALAGLRCATGRAGVVWRGRGVRGALATAFPGVTVRTIRSPRRWLRALEGRAPLPAADWIVATGLDRPHLVRRAEWALEEAGGNRAILVDPAVTPEGFPVVDGRCSTLKAGGRALRSAVLAAVLGLEPDALAIAAAMGAGPAEVGPLSAAPDPGARLAVRAVERGLELLPDGRPVRETSPWHRHEPPLGPRRAAPEDPASLVSLARDLVRQSQGDTRAVAPLRAQLVRLARDAAAPGDRRARAALLVAQLYEDLGELGLTYRFCADAMRWTTEAALRCELAATASLASLELGEYGRALRLAGRAWRASAAPEAASERSLAWAAVSRALVELDHLGTAAGLAAVRASEMSEHVGKSPEELLTLARQTTVTPQWVAGEAVALHEELTARLGAEATQTVGAGITAGSTLLSAGDVKGAGRVLRGVQAAAGPMEDADHPEVAALLQALGRLSATEGNAEQALALFDRARRLVVDRLGGPPHRLADVDRDRARALSALGRAAEARSALERAIELKQQVTGPDSVALAVLELELADLLQSGGERSASAGQLGRALQTLERAGDADSNRFLRASRQRHRLLREAGRLDEALAESRRALEAAGRRNDRPSLRAAALADHGDTLRAMGRYGEAVEAYEAAEGILRGLGPERVPDLARVLAAIGAARLAAGDGAGAAESLRQAIATIEETASPASDVLDRARLLLERIEAR